jgi:tetratricopeptide (TPR) repeat protein
LIPSVFRLCLCLCAVALYAPSAGAQDSARVVVVVDTSDSTRAHARVAHDVRRALHKRKDYTLFQIHSALNAGDEVEAQNNIKTAQGFHDAGQVAFESGDVEDASDQLESAARLMEKSFAALTDITEYRALLLRLGEARLANGDEAAAARALERAVTFRARGWEAPLGPDASEALERARVAVAALPTGAVSITTDPDSAEVWVNGRYSGIAPITVTGLTVGEHVISVARAGYARSTSTIQSSDEELNAIEITLDPARRKRLYDQLLNGLRAEIDRPQGPKTENVASAKTLGSLLLGEVGVVVSTSGPEDNARIDLYLFDPLARRLLSRASTTLDISRRQKDAMVKLVDQLLDIDYGLALGGSPKAAVDTYDGPLTGKWWFWTAIGAGTLGAVTAAILATQEDPPPDPTTGSMIIRF